MVVACDRKLSDHCPIVLKDRCVNFGPKPFKFFDFWMKDVECVEIVKKGWCKPVFSSNPDCIFRDMLKNKKEELKSWSKLKFGLFELKIKIHKDDANKWELLAESRELSEGERELWQTARRNWVEKDNYKTQILKQKARVKWALEGDENTTFFHSTIQKKNNKNGLKGLVIGGSWCEDPSMIMETTFSHFQNIFKEPVASRPRLRSSRFKSLDESDREALEKPFSELEVWGAIKECGSNKAPGPDSFSFGFFKLYWTIVKSDLLFAVVYFWSTGTISNGCNSSFFTLVPKGKDIVGLGDFRPISLIRSCCWNMNISLNICS